MNFEQKLKQYFKNLEDFKKLNSVVDGLLINDDDDFNQKLQDLIEKEGMSYVIGLITKDIVTENIINIQKLIDSNSEKTHESIDLIFDDLQPIFKNIKFNDLEVCTNFYGMSESQAKSFINGILNKNIEKIEFFSTFFNHLKSHGIFKEIKHEVIQSVLNDFMFDKKEKENSKAYNFAFKFKKYQKELNQFDVFFEYLQENYKPNEAYELMSKFIIYVKTDNFKYDLLTDNVFSNEPHIESLTKLRESFVNFNKNESKNDFFNALIHRIKNVQVPAKLQINNAVDYYSSKITFDNSLPYNYRMGNAIRTPGPFVDYAIKNRCFVENNETKKYLAFGRIMATEPINDIYNHQIQYHKENVALNKLVQEGYDVVVFESQKPTLASKLNKKVICIADQNEIDDISSIFDNLINLARNTVEKPLFDLWQVQIGKNFFNLNTLDNIYEMTEKLIQYINNGNISITEQTTINLIDKAISWINACIDLEIKDSNLNIIYSENFRDEIFSLSTKLYAPLKNNVLDLFDKLNPEHKLKNKMKAMCLIEDSNIKRLESYWKNLEFTDTVFKSEEINQKLIELMTNVKLISDFSVEYLSGFESAKRLNGCKVANIKTKYDDKLNFKNQSQILNGNWYYHSQPVFTPEKDYEKLIEVLLDKRNSLIKNPKKFVDLNIKEILNEMNAIFQSPIDSLMKHFSSRNYNCESYINKNDSKCKSEKLVNYIAKTLNIINEINNQLNQSNEKQIFLAQKEAILKSCEENRKAIDELLKKIMIGKVNQLDESKDVNKFKINKC